jgi:uncharacterized caspase-like protein
VRLYAAFTGLNQYRDPRINSLNFACADAEKFYRLTKSTFAAKDAHLFLLLDKEATRTNLLKVIGEDIPRNAKEEDVVLLYFSGHGAPESSDSIDTVSRYIITHDADYDNLFATAVDMDRDIRRVVERIRSELVIIVLDTCFSGQAGGKTFEGPHLMKTNREWRDAIRLSDLELGAGRIILAAADSNGVAVENPQLRHGVFTHFLLKVLTDRSISTEPWISINAVYDQVAHLVYNFTNGRQKPVMNGRVRMARLPLLNRSSS